MSKLIDDAVEALRNLPDQVRDAAARAIINYQAGQDEALQLSDEDAEEIGRRIAASDRHFISLSELDSRIHHLGA